VKRSLRGPVIDWSLALSDTVNSFKKFEKAFMEQYWSESPQTEIRVQIYQGRYTAKGKESHVDYILEHAVKAKYLEPSMSLLEFLGAMRGHYAPRIQNSCISTQPKTLQVSTTFLTEVELLKRDKTLWKQTEPAHHRPQAENYQSQRPPNDGWVESLDKCKLSVCTNNGDGWTQHRQTWRQDQRNYSPWRDQERCEESNKAALEQVQ
jgi:hypothetical protein